MNVSFIRSAAAKSQFINDGRKTVVFAGRSNVGKSSVINLLTGHKGLARVGNSPGKTAHVNYFLADEQFYLVDLPGYGYAKVSHAEKRRWAELLEAFFSQPERITLGVLVVDARHKPTALDIQMCGLFRQAEVPFITVANKVDKLKTSQVEASIRLIKDTLGIPAVIVFSSLTGAGKQEVWHEIRVGLS